MKKTFTFLILILTSSYTMAQSSVYRKIMAEKEEFELEVFLAQLKEFQSLNPDFSNVYYQLGKIEMANFSSLDPIVDRIASRQYVYNSKTNFGLAKNYLDQKEIAKNPEWYDVPDVKSKDSVEILANNLMDEKYEASITYADAYEELILHYDNAVTHYLKAREDFITINTSADNLRQLFLQTDDSLKLAIHEVGISFDSSMYHLDKYRETYQILPHTKKREVIVNYNTIDHFRMNGITPTNFLADYIDVWDYKHWSEDFLNLIEVEVDGLQDEIRTAYQFFESSNVKLINGDECNQVTIDNRKYQRIINLVTKYDNQSVLADIFKYIVSKLEYGNRLNYERNCNSSSSSPTDNFLSRKARVYQDLFDYYTATDSLDNAILISDHGQGTFEWFFTELQSGTNGSVDFANDQNVENKTSFRNEVTGLARLSAKQRFQGDSINQFFGQLENRIVTEKTSEITDSLLVISRLEITDDLAFLITQKGKDLKIVGAQKNETGYSIIWEQSSYKNQDIQYFKTIADSSFVIGGKLWMKHISYTGVVKNTIKLKSADTIVHVSYNDLQGSYSVVQTNGKSHTFSKISSSGKITSSKTLELPGNFLNMWSQEGQLWFFTSSNQNEKTVITASILDTSTSKLVEGVSYTFANLFKDPLLIKNDNESITLLSRNSLNENEIVYSLMDYQGTIHHETVF